MKFYMCGRFQAYSRIATLIHSLTTLGHECTYDWTLHGSDSLEWEGDSPQARAGSVAVRELAGVAYADVVIVILDDPEYAYRGTSVELGAALALEKRVVIYNPYPPGENRYEQLPFYWHPRIHRVNAWDMVVAFMETA